MLYWYLQIGLSIKSTSQIRTAQNIPDVMPFHLNSIVDTNAVALKPHLVSQRVEARDKTHRSLEVASISNAATRTVSEVIGLALQA